MIAKSIAKNKKGLYIHVPFCFSKCKYCDFNSWKKRSEAEVYEYLKVLDQQFKVFNDNMKNSNWDTIYIGGGTPTCLSYENLKRLFYTIESYCDLNKVEEFSIELNPNTSIVTDKKINFISNFVNRVSIGLQTTQSRHLQVLGRTHSYEEFLQTYNLLQSAGIDNLNVDLIYGIPNQTVSDFNEDLDNLIKLQPTHISLYNLILEKDTPLEREVSKGKLESLDEEIEVEMYNIARVKLRESGYSHYELSNFSKPSYECKHNMLYWNRNNYLGLGPGAHSLWEGLRFVTVDDFTKYLKSKDMHDFIKEKWNIGFEEALSEKVILGLRLVDGIDINEIKEEYGINIYKRYLSTINYFISEGLLKKENTRIKLTTKGYMLSNNVFMEFLPS
ncbi:radical SAM family heme chaperone HemW [Natranaerobius trueperi]|uniref:Heme chaperone HemW n=1 Tax=Natranaerobius trueperi TaxID=759412 RepID=A0A226BVQ4_9FIRM|nr:radical SAM family heme chaperone HemW [Natranaerobius trueperi]OWZ83128.1 coproporphyrinogen III oxidase [Natranaerobius trueperi]